MSERETNDKCAVRVLSPTRRACRGARRRTTPGAVTVVVPTSCLFERAKLEKRDRYHYDILFLGRSHATVESDDDTDPSQGNRPTNGCTVTGERTNEPFEGCG